MHPFAPFTPTMHTACFHSSTTTFSEDPAFDKAMILFNLIIEVFGLSELATFGNASSRFQPLSAQKKLWEQRRR